VRIRLDARVDQPWRRDGFRHADLMGWVRANRARLVAACLTLCQAWIAAGRPRGSRSIGSYDSWAQTMGGVLEVAGIEGFLGNLDEMLEAADGESAVWRSFVGSWWDRFGTAEVSTGNLWELALNSEPPLPLGTSTEQSRRTRLGKALGKMRDRMFRVGWLTVQIKSGEPYQGAQRWHLAVDENIGTDERSRRSPTPPDPSPTPADLVNVVNVGERCESNVHEKLTAISMSWRILVNVVNVVNVFRPLTHARTRTPPRGRLRKNVHHVHNVHRTQQRRGIPPVNVAVNVRRHVHNVHRSRHSPPGSRTCHEPATHGDRTTRRGPSQHRADDDGQLRQEHSRRRPDHDDPDHGRPSWLQPL
jgi:hypothetical protein